MTRLADFLGAAPATLTAGESIAANDLVEVGPDNLSYKVVCTDTAAIGATGNLASSSTGQIQPRTVLSAATALNTDRPAAMQSSDGSIYFVTPYSANDGAILHKYTSGGRRIGSVVLATTTGGAHTQPHVIELVDTKNILVTVVGTAAAFGYIVAPTLSVINAAAPAPAPTASVPDVIPLAAGGYAFINTTTAGNIGLTVCDSTGAILVNAVVISTGGPGTLRMAQLSSSNLAYTIRPTSVTVLGMGIVTTGAASVKAYALIAGADPVVASPGLIAVAGAYFAVCAGGNGTNAHAFAFDNTGTQQGPTAVIPMTANPGFGTFLALSDGTNFIIFAAIGGGWSVAKLTNAGALTTHTVTVNVGAYADGFYERNRVCLVGVNSATPKMAVIDPNAGALVVDATAFSAGNTGAVVRTIPTGDYAFAILYDATTPECLTFMGKYQPSAVAGRALDAATVNTTFRANISPGSYTINTVRGTEGVTFDHTANPTLAGNKGALLRETIVLTGYGTT